MDDTNSASDKSDTPRKGYAPDLTFKGIERANPDLAALTDRLRAEERQAFWHRLLVTLRLRKPAEADLTPKVRMIRCSRMTHHPDGTTSHVTYSRPITPDEVAREADGYSATLAGFDDRGRRLKPTPISLWRRMLVALRLCKRPEGIPTSPAWYLIKGGWRP